MIEEEWMGRADCFPACLPPLVSFFHLFQSVASPVGGRSCCGSDQPLES